MDYRMRIRVGYGITAFLKGVSGEGVDGIGQTIFETSEILFKRREIELLPVTFGSNAFHLLNSKCQLVALPPFSLLVATSIITGMHFPFTKKLYTLMDIFHATDHRIPKLKKIPVVATIHDAIPLSAPEWVSTKYRLLISPAFRKSANWAERIITVSNYSKAQIVRHFRINEDRIVVIPNGVNERWFREIRDKEVEETLAKFQLLDRYIIYVGTIQPRKNIERLINAYLGFRARNGNKVGLVIIGRAGWGYGRLLKQLKSDDAKKNGIHWLNYVSNNDLEIIVKSASCLALPSLAEGFGLPVLEAFAAGVPVLTSNTTSLPEVAGDAAIMVNPLDELSILEGLEKILLDPTTSSFLREAGRIRARKFSWSVTADKLIDLYKSVV